MEYVTLNNGVQMPVIGYGTYQTPPSITERCVADALRIGYRSIDTAQCYGNEREVGLACRKSGIPRSELFITTKLWACHGYQDTLRSIEGSLKKLNLDYIDLLLIHEPTGDVHEIYRAMETAYKDGKLRAIGISNFLEERYLDLVNHCKVIPAVNQVETHVFRQQKKTAAVRVPDRNKTGKLVAAGLWAKRYFQESDTFQYSGTPRSERFANCTSFFGAAGHHRHSKIHKAGTHERKSCGAGF